MQFGGMFLRCWSSTALLHPNCRSFKVNPVMIAQAIGLANFFSGSGRTDPDMIAQAKNVANSVYGISTGETLGIVAQTKALANRLFRVMQVDGSCIIARRQALANSFFESVETDAGMIAQGGWATKRIAEGRDGFSFSVPGFLVGALVGVGLLVMVLRFRGLLAVVLPVFGRRPVAIPTGNGLGFDLDDMPTICIRRWGSSWFSVSSF